MTRFHRQERNMFLHDTVSKCVCSGLQKLINYTRAALWCCGVEALLHCLGRKKQEVLFCFPLLSRLCCPHVSLGPALRIVMAEHVEMFSSISNDWGLIEQLQNICFPSCIVIWGFIRGMLHTVPARCILTGFLPHFFACCRVIVYCISSILKSI